MKNQTDSFGEKWLEKPKKNSQRKLLNKSERINLLDVILVIILLIFAGPTILGAILWYWVLPFFI